MDERLIQWRVGVMVLATMLSTAILVALLGDMDTLFQRRYLIHMRFPSVPGVTPETPVRQFGLLVGRVTAVRIAEDRRGAIVTAAINSGTRIYTDEICRIRASLLGDAVIEFVPSGDPNRPQALVQPDDEIEGIVATSPLEVVSNLEDDLSQAVRTITTAGEQVGRAGEEVNTLVRRVNAFLDENGEQVRHMVSEAEELLTSINKSAQSVERFLTDEEVGGKLRETIDRLPTIADEVRAAMANLADAVDSMERNFNNLESFTASVRDEGASLVRKLNRAAGRLDTAFAEIEEFMRALNDPGGNAARLLRDPDLFANLQVTMYNLRLLTTQMRPILDDVRSFTSQIARDPARLINVRTATEQRSLIKQ